MNQPLTFSTNLGGLPKGKMHCSVMGRDALEHAIADYRGQKTQKPEGQIVCECFGVTDLEIERAVRENSLKTIEDVIADVKAGSGWIKHVFSNQIFNKFKIKTEIRH